MSSAAMPYGEAAGAAALQSSIYEMELLSGRSLSLKSSGNERGLAQKKIKLATKDEHVGMGRGNFSQDDPTLYGGTVRIVSANGEFDEMYELPAEGWRYILRDVTAGALRSPSTGRHFCLTFRKHPSRPATHTQPEDSSS